jgi:uncharacterized protein YegJ (DUF2314 family)
MILPLALLLAAASATGASEPVATFTERDDPELVAARAKARASLPDFLAVLAKGSPDTGGFQVRFALTPTEHIWIENVTRDGGSLTGTLVAKPLRSAHSKGDRVTAKLGDVSDWGYWTRDNVAHGFHSYPVLFARLPKAEANARRRELGWPEQ